MASPGNRRVLITGVAGFTGAHLVKRLVNDRWEVFGAGQGAAPEGVVAREIDLLDRAGLAAWISEIQPTHIIHLAALSHVVGESEAFYRVNVVGTENLLFAIDDAGIALEKLIVASSANIYGNARASPIGEEIPPAPMNHYALSKAAMELLVHKWFTRWPILIVRPFNYTGPGQSESFLFPKIVAAYARRDPVLSLGNIEVSRDLSDVSSICEDYARLLLSDARSQTINLCSGIAISIREALDIMADIAGYRPLIKIDPALVRPDEVKHLVGNPARLASLIGAIKRPEFRQIFDAMYQAVDTLA